MFYNSILTNRDSLFVKLVKILYAENIIIKHFSRIIHLPYTISHVYTKVFMYYNNEGHRNVISRYLKHSRRAFLGNILKQIRICLFARLSPLGNDVRETCS